MPVLQRSDSIAAAGAGTGFNANVLTGTQFEFAPYDCLVRLGVLGSASGLQMTFATGADTMSIDQAVSVVRAANQYPLIPDDLLYTDYVGVGQRLIVAIRNTTAGALTAFTTVSMEPI